MFIKMLRIKQFYCGNRLAYHSSKDKTKQDKSNGTLFIGKVGNSKFAETKKFEVCKSADKKPAWKWDSSEEEPDVFPVYVKFILVVPN